MTAGTMPQVPRGKGNAALPAAKRADAKRGRTGRFAGRAVAFYDRLSGPPVTQMERSRAQLVYARHYLIGMIG